MRDPGRWVVVVLLAVLCAGGVKLAEAQPAQLKPEALVQIAVLQQEKASRTPAQQKIDSHLLLALKRQRDDPLFRALPELRPGVEVAEDGTVLVDIKAEVSEGLLQEIAARGGSVVSSHPGYRAIRARLPLAELESIAASWEVNSIRLADRAIVRKVNTSEGDVAHAASLARSTLGADGSGVLACVLSNGIDTAALRIATGDLPDPVFFLTGQAGSGDEGTAMLEIVFDLAPGATLAFATASGGLATMAQNILDLQAAGCNVIVDDIGYSTALVFQQGIVAQAVESVVDAGAVYFSAAGNGGNLNDSTAGVWEGDYADTDADAIHNFPSGSEGNLILTGKGGFYTLKWSDPAGGSTNDYDLLLLTSGGAVVDSSTDIQSGSQDPFESILAFASDPGLFLAIVKSSGSARYLRLSHAEGARLLIASAGQTYGHPATDAAFGVAAVNVALAGGGIFTGGVANPVEIFSSDGPRRIFFSPGGTPITPGDLLSTGGALLQKPDIAAADGVATATPGFDPFFGTSAAAPHAAAIAALMLGESALTRDGLEAVFEAVSMDIEGPGVDRDSGYGIIHARDAVGTVAQTAPDCYVDDLALWSIPNSGPATFRACQTITWQAGVYNNVTGIAATHIFTDGFESGDVSAWSNTVP